MAPLKWHRSAGVPLNKTGMSALPQDKRLIHVLDPIGKCWFSGAMMKKDLMLPTTHHGYERGRRRESALVVQMATTWRLKKLGVSHVDCLHDMTNAFGSSERAAVKRSRRPLLLKMRILGFSELNGPRLRSLGPMARPL